MLLQHVEHVRAVGRVAEHDRPDDAVVLQHQLLVLLAGTIQILDNIRFRAALEGSGRKDIDAGNLQARGDRSAGIALQSLAGDQVGQDSCLFEQRCHGAVGCAPVFNALSHSIDGGVGQRLQVIVDDDAAATMDAGSLGQPDIRTNPGRHDQQITIQHGAVSKQQAGDALLAENGGGQGGEAELHPLLFKIMTEHVAGSPIQLHVHQRRLVVHNGHIHTEAHQPFGRLQSEQAAAKNGSSLILSGRFDQRLAILDIAKGDDALLVDARNRDHEGVGARGDNQRVVCRLAAILGNHLFMAALNLCDPFAQVQGDAMLLVPPLTVQNDILDCHLPGQNR